jgi:septum formation protein
MIAEDGTESQGMQTAGLILASQSKARYHMLRAAGLSFMVQDPDLDETAMQQKLKESMVPPEMVAQALAHAKALSIAHKRPADLVIGADQILYCNGRIYSKAQDVEEARAVLKSLSAKQHELISAVCVAHQDRVIWQQTDRARVTFRTLDDRTIDQYCALAQSALLRSVGAYEVEGMGGWLIDRIEGDHFTIMGLPLLPLLHFLRGRGFGL